MKHRSPQSPSLADLSVEQAAGFLAKLATQKRADWRSSLRQAAGGVGGHARSVWSSAGPYLRGAAVGAGAGALAGAGSAMMSDDEDASPWRSGITGALGGAAVGAGGVAAYKGLHQIRQQTPGETAQAELQKYYEAVKPDLGSMAAGTVLDTLGNVATHPAVAGTTAGATGLWGWDKWRQHTALNSARSTDPASFREGLKTYAKEMPAMPKADLINATKRSPGFLTRVLDHIKGRKPSIEVASFDPERAGPALRSYGLNSNTIEGVMRSGLKSRVAEKLGPKAVENLAEHVRAPFFRPWDTSKVTIGPRPFGPKTRVAGRLALPALAILWAASRSNGDPEALKGLKTDYAGANRHINDLIRANGLADPR